MSLGAIVVGDDPEERELYAFALRQAGLAVQPRGQLAETVSAWADQPGDLLLALKPQTEDLVGLTSAFRRNGPAPLILLLESSTASQELALLRAGADLILRDPTDPRVVAAYCLSLLRRSSGLPASALPALSAGGLTLDPASRSVTPSGGSPTRLTPLEFRLLYLLLTHNGQVLPTEDLIERVWGYADMGTPDLVRGLVSRLRRKLGDTPNDPRYIETVPGLGYRLRAE